LGGIARDQQATNLRSELARDKDSLKKDAHVFVFRQLLSKMDDFMAGKAA